MAIGNLLNLTAQPSMALDAAQTQQGGARGAMTADPLAAAGKLAAQTQTAERANSIDLQKPFQLDSALQRALTYALDYMNGILAPQNLAVSLVEGETIVDEAQVAVTDLNNGRVLKTYPPHEALKFYAQQRYGGVVVDGKI